MQKPTQLDGNVALELVLETNGVDAGDGLDHRRFAVRDMADRADVDGRLAGNHLRRQWRQFGDVLCGTERGCFREYVRSYADLALLGLSMQRRRTLPTAARIHN